MKITLESEEALLIEATEGPMTIEAPSAELGYSAFHMLGSALGYCTMSVLHSWASNADLPTEGLAVRVTWVFVEEPHRVGEMNLELIWPSLPPERLNAAKRVAHLCGVHNTLTHPPRISVELKRTN